jgi:hypothetical protein
MTSTLQQEQCQSGTKQKMPLVVACQITVMQGPNVGAPMAFMSEFESINVFFWPCFFAPLSPFSILHTLHFQDGAKRHRKNTGEAQKLCQ